MEMLKYVKKSIEVEAISASTLLQCFRCYWYNLPECIKEAYESGIITSITDDSFIIKTLEGNMEVTKDDMIIKGIRGELYPCKFDIFKETYEYIDAEKEKSEVANNSDKNIDLENKLIQLKLLITDIMNNHSVKDITIYKDDDLSPIRLEVIL